MPKKIINYILIASIILLVMVPGKSIAEELIKNFEGKKLKSYQDSVGIWTIGYGSIFNIDENRPVKKGDIISEETALRWLRYEIKQKQVDLKKLIKVPVTQNQLDSITSLVFNIGTNAFKRSTLLRMLNAGTDKKNVADQFLKWNKGRIKGKLQVIPGLTNRRILERNLFLK
jgi:lysozyme